MLSEHLVGFFRNITPKECLIDFDFTRVEFPEHLHLRYQEAVVHLDLTSDSPTANSESSDQDLNVSSSTYDSIDYVNDQFDEFISFIRSLGKLYPLFKILFE